MCAMSMSEIRAYVAARERQTDAMREHWNREKVVAAVQQRCDAWEALNLPGWWSELDEFASPVDKPTPIEDVHIFLPLLVDEFEGNEDAARAAWALGVRPADYPQEEQP